jgi:hypothetical protein
MRLRPKQVWTCNVTRRHRPPLSPSLYSWRFWLPNKLWTPCCNARKILLRHEARDESSDRNSVSCQSLAKLRRYGTRWSYKCVPTFKMTNAVKIQNTTDSFLMQVTQYRTSPASVQEGGYQNEFSCRFSVPRYGQHLKFVQDYYFSHPCPSNLHILILPFDVTETENTSLNKLRINQLQYLFQNESILGGEGKPINF